MILKFFLSSCYAQYHTDMFNKGKGSIDLLTYKDLHVNLKHMCFFTTCWIPCINM